MATSSYLVYPNLLFSDGLSNIVIHQPGIFSLEQGTKEEEAASEDTSCEEEDGAPVSSKNRFKSALKKLCLTLNKK